jgi:hypothetical protein
LLLLRSLLPLMRPVAEHERWSPEQKRTLSYLLAAAARSSESALLLTAYGQLWDAEVLVRSVFEGSLRFAYLLQVSDTFEQRHQEYSYDQFRTGLLKDHAKAEELLRTLEDADQPSWKPLRDCLLSDEEHAEIAERFPKRERRALETRWGFIGILGELARSGDPLFRGFPGLAYGYAMASHILHADHIGTSIPLDRDRRSSGRRDAILLTHGVRLMSDIMACLQIRLAVGYRFTGHALDGLTEAQQAIDRLNASFGTIYEDWMNIEYPADEAAT